MPDLGDDFESTLKRIQTAVGRAQLDIATLHRAVRDLGQIGPRLRKEHDAMTDRDYQCLQVLLREHTRGHEWAPVQRSTNLNGLLALGWVERIPWCDEYDQVRLTAAGWAYVHGHKPSGTKAQEAVANSESWNLGYTAALKDVFNDVQERLRS